MSSIILLGLSLRNEGGKGGSLHLGGEWDTVWMRGCPSRPQETNYGGHCRAENGQGGVSEGEV